MPIPIYNPPPIIHANPGVMEQQRERGARLMEKTLKDANKYGGKDSWDDYDNTNTRRVRPFGKRK